MTIGTQQVDERRALGMNDSFSDRVTDCEGARQGSCSPVTTFCHKLPSPCCSAPACVFCLPLVSCAPSCVSDELLPPSVTTGRYLSARHRALFASALTDGGSQAVD